MLGWIWCSDTLFRKLVPGEDPNAGGQRGSGSRRVRHQKIEKIQNQQMWGSRGGKLHGNSQSRSRGGKLHGNQQMCTHMIYQLNACFAGTLNRKVIMTPLIRLQEKVSYLFIVQNLSNFSTISYTTILWCGRKEFTGINKTSFLQKKCVHI